MNSINLVMIFAGAIIMVTNIFRFQKFIRSSQRSATPSEPKERRIEYAAQTLLVLFLCGYILTGVLGYGTLVVALILLGGSIFVALVLTMMFKFVENESDRAVEISKLLVGVIEARDPNLNGHSVYVRNLTDLYYDYLPPYITNGISRRALEYAALLHDIGKFGIPESILNKEGPLTAEEWTLMKAHPRIGVSILKPVASFREISKWILYHHERMDGKGYYGIPGSEIPVPSRIISITDSYATITMMRTYKAPSTHEEAIELLEEERGTQFDAQLLDIFVKIPKEEMLACIPEKVVVKLTDSYIPKDKKERYIEAIGDHQRQTPTDD